MKYKKKNSISVCGLCSEEIKTVLFNNNKYNIRKVNYLHF